MGAGLLLVLLACGDPVWRAQIRAIDARTRDPLATATATLVGCSASGHSYKADASGLLDLGGTGPSPRNHGCSIRVVAPGYAAVMLSFSKTCYSETVHPCATTVPELVLTP